MPHEPMHHDQGRSLLAVHQGALGDIVLTFPTLMSLRMVFSRIHLICRGEVGRLARHLGAVDKDFTTESAAFSSLYGQPSEGIARQVRAYDAVLLFSFSEALEKAIRAIGPENVHRVPPRPAPEAPVHVAPWLMDQVRIAGLLPDDAPSVPPFFAPGRPATVDGDRVILHPGSGSPMKNWPLRHFLEAAKHLAGAGRSAEFLVGPAEEKLADVVAKEGFPVRTFPELTGLADWLREAGGFIGNDSGVSHLAGFLGVPTVAVFGPSDPRQWRPWGPSVSVVGPAAGCDRHPCFEKGNRKCDHRKCLEPNSTIFGEALTL